MKFRLVKDKLKESVRKINHNESKATMKDGTEFNIWTECDSAGEEQTNCTKIAYIGDNWLDERDRVIRENLLGYLSYSYLRNAKPKTAHVQMIQVKDSMRRKGIATALIDSLKQDFGNNIEYGYTTDDGTKLLKGLGIRESLKEEYDNEGNKLSPEQIEFFRNSKIRDNKGNLLVCYHGTSSDFDEFDVDYSWDNFGFHFGTLTAAQDRDGSIIKKVYLNIKNPFYIDTDLQYWDAVGFTEYFLDHEDRVKELPLLQKEWKRIKEQWEEDEMEEYPDTSYWDEEFGEIFRNAFYKSKYDGIKYKNYGEDVGSISYMAFYPNQIKAITNKNPSSSNNINEGIETKRNKEDVFDVHKSEISYYQDYLDNKEYANKKHNTISEIVQMSPNEYFKELEKIFPGTTAEKQKRGMESKEEQKIIDGMKDTILNTNQKLPIPFLNYSDIPGQEGRHRMAAVGELYGWDEKFPVLIVKWTKEQEEEYNKKKISKYIEKAVNKTLEFSYTNYDKFLEELKYQVENILWDKEEKIENYNVKETNSTFILQTNGIEYLIEKDDIKIREESELDDDFDWIDTLDNEDINKLLKELENGGKWWK